MTDPDQKAAAVDALCLFVATMAVYGIGRAVIALLTLAGIWPA